MLNVSALSHDPLYLTLDEREHLTFLTAWTRMHQVMAPGRTSCLVCSTHGGVKELVERRTTRNNNKTTSQGDAGAASKTQHASVSCTRVGKAAGDSWRQSGRNFGLVRSTVAGLITAEIVKVLRPRCPRSDLRNWRVLGGDQIDAAVSSGRSASGGGEDEDQGIKPTRQNSGGPPRRDHQKTLGVVQVGTIPDPPHVVLSTPFDPFSGEGIRVVPEGFTEWGIEEIHPLSDGKSDMGRSTVGRREEVDLLSLRALVGIIFARFGVEISSVSTASPSSECRAGGMGGEEWGASDGSKLLWAEWEKDGRESLEGSRRPRAAIPKVRCHSSCVSTVFPAFCARSF